jgi:hypothetical protein
MFGEDVDEIVYISPRTEQNRAEQNRKDIDGERRKVKGER